MWIWISGIAAAYIAILVLAFALCSAAKMGRSDLPDVEPESDADTILEPNVATTGRAVPETPKTPAEPAEAVRTDR
jgi:hypothetical protein